jgi:NADPH:quinone reductase-like Zn-dependent oxidoreductase
VAEGVRQLVRRWRDAKARGVIVVTSSAAGLYPVPGAEVYAAAKGACVQMVRSLAHLAPAIRVCALCPAFADTQMVARIRGSFAGLAKVTVMPLHTVVDAAMQCFGDSGNAGKCLFVAPGIRRYWAFPGDKVARPVPAPRRPIDHALVAWATLPLPATQRAVMVHTLSADFAKATRVDTLPLNPAPKPGHVLVRRLYAGINASDINFTSGRYFGSAKVAAAKLPFAAGFETVGVVVATAPDVKSLAVGDVVGSLSYGGFAEFGEEPARTLLPGLPPTPEAVALLTSGLTASIALEQAARLRPKEVVLVTAAAGGTGQFAVQLALAQGCHVVATCGGRAKADLLRRLGATRVIDHTAEDVGAVLRKDYPRGVDVIYESVGGTMFDTCLNALAPKGRLVVIGAMSRYASGWAPAASGKGVAPPTVPDVLLWKGASCVGFFLPMHAHHFRRHLAQLVAMLDAGRLQVALDASRHGLEAASAAVALLQSGKSLGKVVLQIPRDLPTSQTPARL